MICGKPVFLSRLKPELNYWMESVQNPAERKYVLPAFFLMCLAFGTPLVLQAQDDMKVEVYDTLNIEKDPVPNITAGEFNPGRGFDIYKSKAASLNISVYGLARYINQLPATQSFTDHLGRKRDIDTRQDIMWHRTFLWASGHFYTPKLRYVISVWGLPSTNQNLIFGNIQYQAHKAFRIGAGIGPNLGSRSMQGPWPYMMSSDRQMAEEALRPGFTSGVWITGEILPRFNYWLMLGNNLSQLGATVTQLTRDLSKSVSVWWMPTTGEFGPRGGFMDFEQHDKLATRFGSSFTHHRDDRLAPISNPNPVNTQVRLSDGVLFYETGALADSVTVQKANYDILAVDAGIKIKGLHVQTEVYYRKLSKFKADGPLPIKTIEDKGFYVQASYPIIKKKLHMYGVTSMLIDEFDRDPWEVAGGLSYFPSGTRSWRLNLHVIRVEKSPAGSSFGFYAGGQSGTVISIGTDILL
jgi:hypothetical protein